MTNEHPQQLNSLVSRLERLEVSNRRRRLTNLAGVMLLGLVVLAGVGRSGARLIEAEGVLLRDAHGELRGSFVIGDDGGVRLTMLDQQQAARAGIWLSPTGAVEQWGFAQNHASPPEARPQARPTTQAAPYERHHGNEHRGNTPHDGMLVTHSSGIRVIERQHDRWTIAYQLTLANQTNRAIDEALYVTLLDRDGYVLAREPRIIQMGMGSQIALRGEIELSPQRAEKVVRAVLAVFR